MDVVSTCPLRVASLRWQPQPGAWTLTIVCKATYLLLPGESRLAPEQDELCEADDHWNDDDTRSLRAASDLAPRKLRADVLLVGSAFAPERQPARVLRARLCIGALDKSIDVFADRAWTKEGVLREKDGFMKMPLTWERAAGGPGTVNPAGIRTGSEALPDRFGMIALPNLQAPDTYVASSADTLAPAGFGPIAPGWPTRKGMGAAFCNAAPADQQLPELRGDEPILLFHLHPEHARLSTTLARISPRAEAARGGASEEVQLTCDTLLIDADRGVCSLTWRGQLALRRADEPGRVVVTATLPGPPSVRIPAWAVGATDPKATQLGAMPRGPALPFAKGAPEVRQEAPKVLDFVSTMPPPSSQPPPALPFREGQAPPIVDMKSTMPLGFGFPTPVVDMKTTMPATAGIPAPALPFPPAPETPRSPRFGPPPETPRFGPPPETPRFGPSPETPRFGPPPETPRFGPPPEAPRFGLPSPEPALLEAPPPEPAPPELPPPEPPPLIGPLAKVEMPAPADPAPAPAAEPKLPINAFPIARCAAIAASIARRRDEEEEILEENELDAETWAGLDRHWSDSIRKEAARGKTALLKAYDAAYLAQIERERGPIEVDDYARLVVAAERGAATDLLATMALPRGAMLRLERVWLRRIAGDDALAAQVHAAVVREREA